MSAKDAFHEIVKLALQKEGWQITHDPFYLSFGGVEMYVDLGAERLIAAEKENEQIAIEIKSFLAPSAISEFHTAIGQFINYRCAIKQLDPNRTLYLAVPLEAYNTFFNLQFPQIIIQECQIKIMVYDRTEEIISKWIR